MQYKRNGLEGWKYREDGEYTVITTDDVIQDYKPERVLIDKRLRKRVLEAAENICENCQQYYPYLEIHHKDGNRSHSIIENLMPVCPNCHKLLDIALQQKDEEII